MSGHSSMESIPLPRVPSSPISLNGHANERTGSMKSVLRHRFAVAAGGSHSTVSSMVMSSHSASARRQIW